MNDLHATRETTSLVQITVILYLLTLVPASLQLLFRNNLYDFVERLTYCHIRFFVLTICGIMIFRPLLGIQYRLY